MHCRDVNVVNVRGLHPMTHISNLANVIYKLCKCIPTVNSQSAGGSRNLCILPEVCLGEDAFSISAKIVARLLTIRTSKQDFNLLECFEKFRDVLIVCSLRASEACLIDTVVDAGKSSAKGSKHIYNASVAFQTHL